MISLFCSFNFITVFISTWLEGAFCSAQVTADLFKARDIRRERYECFTVRSIFPNEIT